MASISLCKRCWKRNGIAKPAKAKIAKEQDCKLCLGGFLRIADLGSKAIAAIDKSPGSETFSIGTRLTKDSERYEEDVWDVVDLTKAESVKGELNREIGKWVEKNSKYKFSLDPHVRMTVGVTTGGIEAQIASIYLYGRYRKLKRGVRQTKKEGSDEQSVEAAIEAPLLEIIKGQKAVLHGCVTGDTKILLNECTCSIEDLQNKYSEHEALCYDESRKHLDKSQIVDWFGFKSKTFKLQTRETGRAIIATTEHPFFTKRGMVPLANIKAGDFVAVNPTIRECLPQYSTKEILTADQLKEAVKQHVPVIGKGILKELDKKCLLPLKENDTRVSIFSRLIGFLFGDGHVKVIRNRDVALEFYGQMTDLRIIQMDLKRLGFYSHISNHRSPGSEILDYYGNVKTIKSTVSYRLSCYSKSLWVLLVALGAPVGNKIKINLFIPRWILSSNRLVKQEFLSALLGCEIDKPRLDKRKHNKKSFNTPRFSMNKIERNLDNGLRFIQNISDLLREFNVCTLPIRKVPYSTRKDGERTIKLVLDISNEYLNLINLWRNVGLRYCKDKETHSAYALEYLMLKQRVVERRQSLFEKAKKSATEGRKLSEIHSELNSKLISKKNLWLWLRRSTKKENIKVPNGFPNFDVWMKTAVEGLSDGLVWETVESIEPIGKMKVYDITVPAKNNFFANGFLVSNSGREDIDVIMAGKGRPFVIEIVKPQIRKFDAKKAQLAINKSAKGIAAVEALVFCNKNKVEVIKRAKFDKTYEATVEVDEPIAKSDLQKLPNSVALAQRTPLRVVNRRADLIRKRTVKRLDSLWIDKTHFKLIMTTQSGTYIKEFINGDEGRTQPNISAMLNRKAKCAELTVTAIHSEWLEDFW